MVSGRTFATTGPLLVAGLDDRPPGVITTPGSAQHRLAIEAWASGDESRGLSLVEVLRNGTVFERFPLNGQTAHFQTTLSLHERGSAWYCVRASQGEAQNRVAISGAFYFAGKTTGLPQPVKPRIHVRILDSLSGLPIGGTVTEVTFEGAFGRDGKRHSLKSGEGNLVVPGIGRLRAESSGYKPVTLSPFLDNPKLVQMITSLNDSDLLEWSTFERVREQLENVELVFRIEKK
jgi:hypothetical protein